jgi:hypothetical protein
MLIPAAAGRGSRVRTVGPGGRPRRPSTSQPRPTARANALDSLSQQCILPNHSWMSKSSNHVIDSAATEHLVSILQMRRLHRIGILSSRTRVTRCPMIQGRLVARRLGSEPLHFTLSTSPNWRTLVSGGFSFLEWGHAGISWGVSHGTDAEFDDTVGLARPAVLVGVRQHSRSSARPPGGSPRRRQLVHYG